MANEKPLVLITGASGFIAGHIVRQALEDGYKVRGTVRSVSNLEKYKYLTDMGDVELVAANLMADEGWDEAMVGIQYVLHTASPFIQTTNEDEVVKPAVEGTQRVLQAASRAPTVERVVVTASCATVSYGHPQGSKPEGYKFGPKDFSVVENLDAYSKSKLLAEKEVWKFKEESDCKFDVCTVHPALVMGPLVNINSRNCESASLVRNIMTRQLPSLANIHIGVVDVRDVAIVHVRALTAEGAPGKRLISSPKSYWLGDLGTLLYNKYSPDGWNPTTMVAPDFMIKILANFDTTMSLIAPDLGFVRDHDVSETEEVIGFKFRDPDQAFFDMVDCQVDMGIMEKPQGGGCHIL